MSELPPLWQHQKDAIERASNRFALFFDPGCGKTRTAIEIYAKSNVYRKALIFAPLNVCRNWEVEIDQYFAGESNVSIVAGQSKSKKTAIISQFLEHKCTTRDEFLICNLESLRSKDFVGLLCHCSANVLIVDESHNFKSPTSLQTKGLITVKKWLQPDLLLLLTGTPAPQGEIDLWSTFYLLEKTKDTFFVWRKKWFDDQNERRRGTSGYWPNYTIRASSREKFRELLAQCSVTACKDEVLDLPPLLRTNIYCEMSKEQKRNYETMVEYLFAIDDLGDELNAANLLSRTLRLQQILAGFIGEVPIAANPRLDALDAAIEKTSGAQFIIWTIFRGTYGQIVNKLVDAGITCGLLTGEQSADVRFENMEKFQRGELRALIAHPRAGGVGVNLTAASYSIHYTRSYSLVDDLQAEARNYRGGSERHNRITRIDIITPNTIDEEIQLALKEKKTAQEFILGLRQRHGK